MAAVMMLALVLAGCASSRSDQAGPAPNMSGGGNPMTDMILAGCPNARAIAELVPKAEVAVEQHVNQRGTAKAATRAFYDCARKSSSDLTRDWATLNAWYWLAHTAVRDRSGIQTLDEATSNLDALAARTHYPEIRDGAQRMSAAFRNDEQQLRASVSAPSASARAGGNN